MAGILKTIESIEKQVESFQIPWVTIESKKKDPYRVLISCILSLRTKDKTTAQASKRLFKAASTPGKMLKIPARRIQELIYPVGFYRNKSKAILGISKKILDHFEGRVPDNMKDLLTLKGVGRKTANLVLGLGYNIPAICVDTHVHRISNRLGWVKTKEPHATEEALRKIIPRKNWVKLNTLLVAFGQNLCLPVSPFCSRCYVRNCPKTGVERRR
ncbi:MAG: endonuclease III [Candidatus Omnitrophica bacterium]|nr:endonuclease III [Candidatus Omnitrophota bacterium]MDD5552379.1 endonuclease III [Candidatus Omnitrophota bacterium]